MWFENLTGFSEESPEQVRSNLAINEELLISNVNGRTFRYGHLEIPSLSELRKQAHSKNVGIGKLSLREVVADVQQLHADSSNAGALFQVASQFNLLEMVSPGVTPEQGISGYEHDYTQGPACAIACGAGTIFRNYFVKIGNQIGQSAARQIDCLFDLGTTLGNKNDRLWVMRNGYCMASEKGLSEIRNRLDAATMRELDELRGLLRIGVQWQTEVTIANSRHTVSQAYCSALPVAYSIHSSEKWEAFARFVLEASYEAVFCAGILNYLKTGNNTVYLTLIGDGAFGNKSAWVMDAIRRSLALYKDVDLDIAIVSYGYSKEAVQELVQAF